MRTVPIPLPGSATHATWFPRMPTGGLALVLLCVIPPVIEESAVQATGFSSAAGLSPAASATPVLGVFHDLRWLYVYHDSWWTFGAEIVLAVALRSAFLTAVARAMWPDGAAKPPIRDTLRNTVTFTVATMVMLSPWAVVAMAASAMSLSWFVLGEVLPVLFLVLVLSRGGIVRQWWRGLPTPGALLWSFLGFVMMSVGAVAITSVPGPWAIPVAGAAGAVNAVLWRGLVRSVVSAPVRLRWFPSVPAAFLTGVGALLFLAHTASTSGAINVSGGDQQASVARAQAAVPGKTIVFVAGYGSGYKPTPQTAETPPVRFSYRGTAADGTPLGYRRIATHQSLGTAAALLDVQVRDAARRTGKPVALVAQSEGTAVVRTYLAKYPHPQVSDAVMLSPLIRPGRVYFPPAGAESGWGIAAGWVLRGMLVAARWAGPEIISHADEPFVRSIVDHGPFFRNTMLCADPGVREIILVPTAAGAVVPPGTESQVPIAVVPGLHATLLQQAGVDERIARFLQGGGYGHGGGDGRGGSAGPDGAGDPPGPAFTLAQRAAAAWQAPALAIAVNPVWEHDVPDAAFRTGGHLCDAPTSAYRVPGDGVTPQ